MKVARIVAALWMAFFLLAQSTGNEASGGIARPHFTDQKIGFWLPLNGLAYFYSEDEFFNTYFLTPPYPAFVEFISAQDWDTREYGDWVKGVALRATPYPEIEISVMLAWNFGQEWQWENVKKFLENVKDISSIKYVGVEAEHSRNLGATDRDRQANYDRAKAMVEEAGFTFVSYYLRGSKEVTSKYLEIGHTNYPCEDPAYTLDWHTGEQHIGQSAGLFEDHDFPNNSTIFPWHWNQSSVYEVIDKGASKTPDQRHVIVFVAGHSTKQFVGASGKITTHLWDHPLFRQWIWERQQGYPRITYIGSNMTPPPYTADPTTTTTTKTQPEPPSILTLDARVISYATFAILIFACGAILTKFLRKKYSEHVYSKANHRKRKSSSSR